MACALVRRGHFVLERFKAYPVVSVTTNFSTQGHKSYDLIVIGGGSGGLACAKEAQACGMRVAVLDAVSPSPRGSRWGLGGHLRPTLAAYPRSFSTRQPCWDGAVKAKLNHDWAALRNAVQAHVRSLNWGHRVQLNKKKVDYYNAHGKFIERQKIVAQASNGKEEILVANKFVIAVGGRPIVPHDVPGLSDNAITSDDIFSLENPPGKTLVIGASYVALECAGFLNGLGYDTTVMVRSICLRGFDQQMAKLVTDHMTSEGTKFLWKCLPKEVNKLPDGKLKVKWCSSDGRIQEDIFGTILVAVGRQAETSSLNLDAVKVDVNPKNKKIIVDKDEQSSARHIYAIGDVIDGKPELTPQCPYNTIRVHCSPEKDASHCYIKAIVNLSKPEHVLGLHMTGPHAGEVIQGFAAAFKSGLTRHTLEQTIGIHPTVAEEVVKLWITKRSGEDPQVTGC
ncbi:hypothetical protein MRX96_039964 [Rhipicephalus microplus]